MVPPTVDGNGFGLRVPAIVISPYAKRGCVDHQTLSFDAFNKFIEDDFLGGQRINPATDGRPDPRPDVRESLPILGNMAKDFDFSQKPRPPMLLPLHPRPGPSSQMGPKRLTSSSCGSDLTVTASPRTVRAGRRTRIHFTVAVPPQPSRSRRAGTPVADALVTFDGQRVHTNRHGRATITLRLRHRGSVQVAGTRSGLRAVGTVRVR